jgi:hypothetical protein
VMTRGMKDIYSLCILLALITVNKTTYSANDEIYMSADTNQ